MASLFGKNKLYDIASKLDASSLRDEIEIVKSWHNDYHNGSLKLDKETSREQAYNQDFFIKILGYREKPTNPYTFEPKSTTEQGQLPDAVIKYEDSVEGIQNVAAVVELKGAAVELDRPQRREGNFSPVQQAFKYKTQYRNCPFVIVSNFWEFRLYNDNQLDYESWTLDELADPADDYFKFRTFYALIRSENLTSPRGTSRTEELLSDIRLEQEEIGKKFYKVYREARLSLLRDIYSKNEHIRRDIETGIKKTQKIIDRIVFACFAEDRGLLPDNTVRRVINASDSSAFGGTLWSTFKAFFEAIDTGSEKLGIPEGYNGGLFAYDAELNGLQIGDAALRSVVELSNYNFIEDLSVSILGHIFEQSISDLEEIRNKVNESQNLEIIQQSRRKKDGIYYTPDYIVRYIVDNSLGAYLREHEEMFKQEYGLKGDITDKNYEKREKQAYGKYQDFLQRIKVLDPACGSGAFLVYVFDYLLAENNRVADILGNTLFSNEEYIKSILQNNIYGVDLNEESVEITKLSLWLKTAYRGRKLTTLDSNIRCGNSLIDDSDVVGDKAFSWENQFTNIMNEGGFDVVVGNPPYVRQELIRDQVGYLTSNYSTYAGKADLYVYFFELAIKLLKEGGHFGYISSGKFLEANYGKPLLRFLGSNTKLEQLISFGDLEVFEGISAYPVIVIARKSHGQGPFLHVKVENLDFSSLDSVVVKDAVSKQMSDFVANDYKLIDSEISKLFEHLRQNSRKFTDVFPSPTVGVKTGLNDAYLSASGLPYVFGRDLKRYQTVKDGGLEKIIFPYKWTDDGYSLLSEEDVGGIEQLRNHKRELSSRAIIREGIVGGNKVWYEYQQINKRLNFDEEYIVYPNVSLGSNFTLSRGNVIDMTGFIIPSNSRYLLALLNSRLFAFFMGQIAISRRGGYQEFKNQYVTQFPVKHIDETQEKSIGEMTDTMLRSTGEFQSLNDRFKKIVTSEFNARWPRKLNRWWDTNFDRFVELFGLPDISLQKRDELFGLFEKYHKELNASERQIEQVSQKIDQIIYKLYELEPKEIVIVETKNHNS